MGKKTIKDRHFLPASKEARGQRLKQLRQLTGHNPDHPLTRAAIERKHGLSARTLKNWEDAHGAGLTEGGARRVIDIYQKENINCAIAWLLQGAGPSPERQRSAPLPTAPSDITNPLSTVQAERAYFESLHPEGVTFDVKDDAMLPFYRPGDVVGGVRHYAADIPNLIDQDCVIEIKTGETWLRRLQNSTVPGQYNLYALNPSTKVERPTVYAAEVLTAAPIVRQWRGKKWL